MIVAVVGIAVCLVITGLLLINIKDTRARTRSGWREFVDEYESTTTNGMTYSAKLQAHYAYAKRQLAQRGLRSWIV